jgi:molybdopterin-guanine dinucleotide biosynthesis protein B
LPKLVAVVGGKHSGKTTVVEQLIAELKHRGFRVGAIKEMVRIPTLDTPQTETDRYTQAGAEVIVAVPRQETVVFIKKCLILSEILPHLEGLDYAILEGFEKEKNIPKIITAKTAVEAQIFLDESTIAISGIILDSENETMKAADLKIPLFKSLTEVEKLADLIENKTASCKGT